MLVRARRQRHRCIGSVGHGRHRGWVFTSPSIRIVPQGYGRVSWMPRNTGCACAASKSCSSWCVPTTVLFSRSNQSSGLLEQERTSTPSADGASRHRNQESAGMHDRLRPHPRPDVRVLSDHHTAESTPSRAARQRRNARRKLARPMIAAPARRCCRTIWRSAPWCWCGSFAIRAYVNGYDDILIRSPGRPVG